MAATPKSEPLLEAFVRQCPARSWLVNGNLEFETETGDSGPIFGKSGAKGVHDLAPEQSELWRNRLARVLGGETLSLRERGAGTLWNISVFPIRVEGQIRYAGILAREVSAWNQAEQELRNTVLGALKAQEYEREKASRFLHDTVGQNLTALGLQLDLVRMDLESVAPESYSRIAEIQKMLGEMMESVREYSYELNPSTVERAGLRVALDRLAVRIRERFAGTFRLNVDPSVKLEKRVASAMYQIAQEAVENALQHSSCSVVEIAVKSTRIASFLEIKDNGKGFDPANLSGGYRGLGFLSMEHYAAQAGLELSVISNPGSGTTVRAASKNA